MTKQSPFGTFLSSGAATYLPGGPLVGMAITKPLFGDADPLKEFAQHALHTTVPALNTTYTFTTLAFLGLAGGAMLARATYMRARAQLG